MGRREYEIFFKLGLVKLNNLFCELFLSSFIDLNINSCLMIFLDVRTQAMYQLLDSGFIGLIFSCFNEDVHKVSAFSWGPEG